MQTVLPREEAVEGVISKVLESQEACDRLNEVFYEHLENYQEINDDGDRHFAEVLLQAYKNGDVSALLLELCGGSMFDLLRDAYLIPKKFHGKSGENPVLLTDVEGKLLESKKREQLMNMKSSMRRTGNINVHRDQNCILLTDMT